MNKIINYCAVILISVCIGICIGTLSTKNIKQRLDLVEKVQDEFIERFNKYQIEEREYIDTNDGYLENKINEVEEYTHRFSDGIESIVRDRVIGKFDDRDDFGECSNKKND